MKYGITWATSENSIAQTGYEFDTVDDAKAAALLGHYNQPEEIQVDLIRKVKSGQMVYAMIETEADTVEEIEVGLYLPMVETYQYPRLAPNESIDSGDEYYVVRTFRNNREEHHDPNKWDAYNFPSGAIEAAEFLYFNGHGDPYNPETDTIAVCVYGNEYPDGTPVDSGCIWNSRLTPPKLPKQETTTVELRLRVSYGYDDERTRPPLEECKAQLEDLVKLAFNRGLLTNETDMVVESHEFQVTPA